MSSNRLTALPTSLGNLHRTEYFDVADNPLVYPPPAIMQETAATIFRYLREHPPEADNE